MRVGLCIGYLVLLTSIFIRPLLALALYAAGNDLHSHILLTPFVSAYLVYLRRGRPVLCRSSVLRAGVAAALGISALVARVHWANELSPNDGFSLLALGMVGLAIAGGFAFLGGEWMTANAFPVGFLLFFVPLPDAAVNWLENASMLASADAAAFYLRIWGVAVVRTGTIFELPGITIKVARECSGIHSSWVLFVTSVLTSHLFLKSRWRRLVLVMFVIPLGILRNGFRILVISWLCVNIGPEMIDSPIHHQGGPIFFVLSLFPLFALLWWLRRQDWAAQRVLSAGSADA